MAAVPPHRIVDPTGVGDAFRGGLLKGMARGASYSVCAQIGSVAATYALEHLGGQSHAYTWPEFLDATTKPHFGTRQRPSETVSLHTPHGGGKVTVDRRSCKPYVRVCVFRQQFGMRRARNELCTARRVRRTS